MKIIDYKYPSNKNPYGRTIFKNSDEKQRAEIKAEYKKRCDDSIIQTYSSFYYDGKEYIGCKLHENGLQYILTDSKGLDLLLTKKKGRKVVLDAYLNEINQRYSAVDKFNELLKVDYPDGFTENITTVNYALKRVIKSYYKEVYEAFNITLFSLYNEVSSKVSFSVGWNNYDMKGLIFFNEDGDIEVHLSEYKMLSKHQPDKHYNLQTKYTLEKFSELLGSGVDNYFIKVDINEFTKLILINDDTAIKISKANDKHITFTEMGKYGIFPTYAINEQPRTAISIVGLPSIKISKSDLIKDVLSGLPNFENIFKEMTNSIKQTV